MLSIAVRASDKILARSSAAVGFLAFACPSAASGCTTRTVGRRRVFSGGFFSDIRSTAFLLCLLLSRRLRLDLPRPTYHRHCRRLAARKEAPCAVSSVSPNHRTNAAKGAASKIAQEVQIARK